MPGGLLQLKAIGDQNVILNGNPSKTFFKTTYNKFTNFAFQKFRLDFEGSKTLRLSEPSKFSFEVKRYADLLVDAYVSVTMPNIWSPIMPPVTKDADNTKNTGAWIPYEFKWIEYLGAMMIQQVSITCGNSTIQEYSGDYLLATALRDMGGEKKSLFLKMIGHEEKMNDPANAQTRMNTYPNAYYTENENGAEPSIRGRQLLIPLNAWFMMKTQNAVPLVSLQYNILTIHVTMRPIQELFKIRDVFDSTNNYPYISPNFNLFYMQFYRFLQTPPDVELGIDSFDDRRVLWNADVHMIATYGFLSEEERRIFAERDQKYLFKQVKEHVEKDVVGTKKIKLDLMGLVPSLTFLFKRSDVNLRNEWSNFTNWPYNYIPYDITPAPTTTQTTSSGVLYSVNRKHSNSSSVEPLYIAPGVNVNGNNTGWHLTGDYKMENTKNILVGAALLFDGNYRENLQSESVFKYVEKYTRTVGGGYDGIYQYGFSVNDSLYQLQPSGAANMSKINNIELEVQTIEPPLDPNAQTLAICDPSSGVFVGVNKPHQNVYDYTFDMTIFEERYNILHFSGGNAGLAYAT
tara:strand:- start:6167 stop:7885 length:1719 start_codon:yes stop_codon:yes gene_type:complete